MPRGTTLAKALAMLKGELGTLTNTSIAPATDLELQLLIDNTQLLLADTYDWPFLNTRSDVAVTAGVLDANRFYDFPETLNLERPVKAETLWGNRWHTLDFGIDSEQFNAYSSGDGDVAAVQTDPIARWGWRPDDATQFEVWPLPATSTTVRFSGQRKVDSLATASGGVLTFTQTDILELDDLLVVLFAATDKLARMKKTDASLKQSKAEQRLGMVRASYNSKNPTFSLTPGSKPERRLIKITTG